MFDKNSSDTNLRSESSSSANRTDTGNLSILTTSSIGSASISERRFCVCNKLEYEETGPFSSQGDILWVECGNPHCKLQWFHFDCMGITSKPKGKWYCPHCRCSADRPNRALRTSVRLPPLQNLKRASTRGSKTGSRKGSKRFIEF